MNKKGFTLIELLAVIIILGILMIIAIPSVTKYINDSRKSSYIDTAQEVVGGVRNIVNEGKLGTYDTNTTYYIPASYVKTENALKSPYGEFTEAYVGVIYDGKGYKYYWISVDDAGQGVPYLTPSEKLDIDDIESDLKDSDITNVIETTGIGDREYIKILKDDGTWNDPIYLSDTSNNIGEDGSTREAPVCIAVKNESDLHTAICKRTTSGGCLSIIGYDNTITYGTIKNGNPKPGDAYDCKVTKDGGYTERFYYVTSEGENTVLIYYKDVSSTDVYAYDSSNQNWHGPRTAYSYLPSIDEWDNKGIIPPGTRNIVNELGTGTTNNGSNNIESFTYTNKAARMITYQEIKQACGSGTETSSGYLDNCNFLLENVGQYERSSGGATATLFGYWIENPASANGNKAWYIMASSRYLRAVSTVSEEGYTIRPVITVKTSDLG